MRLLNCLLAAILVAPLASAAQQPAKRPMTFADLMAMKRVSDPQISPSGKWVLFSVTDVSLEKNTKTNHLWVVPLDGSAKERQVTSGDGESNGRFSPDGKSIALSMKDQIYTMPWDDAAGTVGAPTQMTNVNGGADGAIWSPDSRRLLFVVDVYPECSDLGDWSKEDACDADKQKAADASPVKAQIWDSLLYRHWDHFTGKRRSHIAVVDADGQNLRDLTPRSAVGDAETPTFSLGGPLGYAWAPDSHEIAYVTNLEVGFAKPGVFPQPRESTFALAHIDCDLYEPMKAALAFFYERMPRGGMLILHDYSSTTWAGATQAINEFCAASGEFVTLWPDKSGTAMIRKSK